MPIYSYRCDSCENEFDVREGFDAPSIRDCTCGAQKSARRVIHPVGVIYKGSGFYTTDYARKGSSNGSNGSNGSSSSSTPASSSSENAASASSAGSSTSSNTESSTDKS